MPAPRVLILRAAGTNCDLETQHAWALADAQPERVHLRRLSERPALLDDYQIVTIPGGFSFGDDLGAGRIFAAQLQRNLYEPLTRFVDSGRLILGICNGFQILVKAGLLPEPRPPGAAGALPACTVTFNDPPGFQDRWVCLHATPSPCVFLEPGRRYEMPIAHGEGRVVFSSAAARQRVLTRGLAALRYAPPEWDRSGSMQAHCGNPNGSEAGVAALCDATGRVLGLMPHPDRFVDWTQHPCWTSLPARAEGDGLALFRRAVEYLR